MQQVGPIPGRMDYCVGWPGEHLVPGEFPMELVLVRHGRSEGNLAWRASKRGNDSYFTPEFMRTHTSKWRLTETGRQQARTTGDWIRTNVMLESSPERFGYSDHPFVCDPNTNTAYYPFDRMMTSEYVRARETAALLGLPIAPAGKGWYIDPFLREREYGELDGMTHADRMKMTAEGRNPLALDAFFGIPPSGESIAQLCMRVRTGTLATLIRKCGAGRAVVVCHGETMWAFRILLERLTSERFLELDRSTDPHDRIHNAQVLWYSRRERDENGKLTGRVSDHLDWKLSVCPNALPLSPNRWEPVVRPTFSNEELLASAEAFGCLFPEGDANIEDAG